VESAVHDRVRGHARSCDRAVRCEIFEVKQVGGMSYWLAVVGNDGRLKSLEITVTTAPRSGPPGGRRQTPQGEDRSPAFRDASF
jgi:hypothetical protein